MRTAELKALVPSKHFPLQRTSCFQTRFTFAFILPLAIVSAFFTCLFFISSLYAQGYDIAREWKAFTIQEGLSRGKVWSMLQDDEGILWFGTFENGITRFNGAEWQDFTTQHGLRSNRVSAMIQDNQQRIWVATSGGGLNVYTGRGWDALYDETKWFVIDVSNSKLNSDHVYSVLQDSRGGFWFGTENGISYYNGIGEYTDPAAWQVFTDTNTSLVLSIFQDSKGDIWAGTSRNGIRRYDGKTWQTYSKDVAGVNQWVWSISEDDEKNLWFASFDGVTKYDGASWQTFTKETGDLTSNLVDTMLRDSYGNLWLGTRDSGVILYDGTSWQHLDKENSGLVGERVDVILEDQEGSLWFSNWDEGVVRYSGSAWRNFNLGNSGLRSVDITTIAYDRKGYLWVGTYKGGISRFDGKSWETCNVGNDSLESDRVNAIIVDTEGALWVGSESGVSRYDGQDWSTFNTTNSGIITNTVKAISQDRQNHFWFGTSEGISYYDGMHWQTFSTSNSGLVSDNVNVIAQDKNGGVWLGTNSGISYYKGGKWRTFTVKDGLPSNDVRSILEDNKGNIWAATSAGAARYDGQSWRIFDAANSSLPDNMIRAIYQDSKGIIWFGTRFGGLTGYDGISWQTFDWTNSSLQTNEVTAIGQDGKGNLWIGTWGGGVNRHIRSRVAPWVRVEKLTTPGGHFFRPSLVELEGNFSASFLGGDLQTDPGEIQYAYRLDGWTQDWNTTELPYPIAEYFGMPAGHYTFTVRARDIDFNYSAPATIQIVVKPLPTATPVIIAGPTRLVPGPTRLVPGPTQIVPGPAQVVEVEPTATFFGRPISLTALYTYALAGLITSVVATVGFGRWRVQRHTRQAITRKDNPYIANVPVKDPKMFFGREEILSQIINGVDRNNFAVCGPIRIGKTSLLHRLADALVRLDNSSYLFRPVMLSLHGVAEEDFFQTVGQAIARQCRVDLNSLSLHSRASGEVYDVHEFVSDLDSILGVLRAASAKPLRLVLLIDEGDALNEYSQRTLAQLRYVFMVSALDFLGMVWTGEKLDQRPWELQGSDWLNIFAEPVFHLTPLTPEEAIDLIQNPVPYYRYDKEAIRLILDKSQLVPHRIQLLCRAAVEEMLKKGRGRIKVKDVEAAIRSLSGGTIQAGSLYPTALVTSADVIEQQAHRLAEPRVEYHTDADNEEAE